MNNSNFSYKSYDKREDYTFEVISYPDLSVTSRLIRHMAFSFPNANDSLRSTAP